MRSPGKRGMVAVSELSGGRAPPLFRQRATFPDSWIRNANQALALAKRANQLSGDNPAILRTLAAAYAENGRFAEARATAERGLQLANAQENLTLVNIFEGDLAHYRINTPVRTATQPAPGP